MRDAILTSFFHDEAILPMTSFSDDVIHDITTNNSTSHYTTECWTGADCLRLYMYCDAVILETFDPDADEETPLVEKVYGDVPRGVAVAVPSCR